MSFTTSWTLPEFNFDYLKGQDLKAFEIGCFEGRSTCWWFKNIFLTENCLLECIDPWEFFDPKFGTPQEIESRFDENTKGLNIIKYKMTSYEWFMKQKRDFDFGYIDGWHEGFQVLEDLVLGWKCIKVGGFLLCDDYRWTSPNVLQPAIQNL